MKDFDKTQEMQIINWLAQDRIMQTEYGYITAEEWIAQEKARIPNSRVEHNNLGEICLVRKGLVIKQNVGIKVHSWINNEGFEV